MPRVSVIIPAYNAERYLGEALDSVMAQTWRDIEVVVVDDGSTDGTQEIVRGYGPPVRLLEQANAGPAAARNRGVREAEGELVAFLDSDDLWLPEKLALQVPLFDAEGRVALVYCKAERMTGDGTPIPTPAHPRPTGDVFLALLGRNHCPTSGVVVRRDVFLRFGGFPEDMVWAEDWHLWLRIAREHEFDAVQQVLVRRSRRPIRARGTCSTSRSTATPAPRPAPLAAAATTASTSIRACCGSASASCGAPVVASGRPCATALPTSTPRPAVSPPSCRGSCAGR